MEKIYWICDGDDQAYANSEIARYGGHVTMISVATTTEDQCYCVHAFVDVEYPDDSNPYTDE